MRDPLRPAHGAANLGAAGLGRNASQLGDAWELGDVLQYNSATHTSLVRTHSGRPLPNVPQMKGTAGGFDHLTTGTTVVISWNLGFPVIIGCIDLPGPKQSAIPAPTITGVEGVGDSDPTQPTQGSNNYKPPWAPTDMGGGDWAQVGTLGNHVAVFEGGLTSMGSPSALVQSLGATGTLRTVARRLQQLTDFGQMTVENDKGRTSLVLRAGANQTAETGLDEQHWTIRLDLGATGDVLDFQITEPEGKVLFRLHAGSDGRVQIYGDGGVDLSSGPGGTATMRHDVVGDHATAVTGSHTHSIGGDATTTIDGTSSHSTAGDAQRSTGKNLSEFVGGNHDVGVSGDQSHAISGDRTAQISGDDKTNADGDVESIARQTHTTDGVQVKHGANAVQPVIRGTDFGSSVIAQLSTAGTTLTTAAATAAAGIAPDVFSGTPTAATIAAVTTLATALAAVGAALLAAAGGYPTTLSTKVVTE